MLLNLLIGPITTLIERLIPDKEKSDEAKAEMMLIMVQAQAKDIESKAKVVIAEATGESWLQRNWRPLTMMFFLVLLGSYWFGLAPQYLIENPSIVSNLFTLLEIGIGGYIVGRSGEKIAERVNRKKYFDSLRNDYGALTPEQVAVFSKALEKAENGK
jgi:hypothetical protein